MLVSIFFIINCLLVSILTSQVILLAYIMSKGNQIWQFFITKEPSLAILHSWKLTIIWFGLFILYYILVLTFNNVIGKWFSACSLIFNSSIVKYSFILVVKGNSLKDAGRVEEAVHYYRVCTHNVSLQFSFSSIFPFYHLKLMLRLLNDAAMPFSTT